MALILATYWPGLKHEEVPDLVWLPFDKTMHVLTFAGLAMWMTWPKWFTRWGWAGNALAAVGIGMAFGVIKEFTQPFVGRTGAFDDLIADATGLIVGAPIAIGVAVWLTKNATDEAPNDSTQETTKSEHGGWDAGGGGGFVGHAALVSALTLVSRMLGLVRDAVLAAVFGASMVLDAFLIGFIVPNLFRRLFGEGALTAAFIPRYTKLLKDDPALARRFASLCVVVVAMLLAGITLIGELVLSVWLANSDQEKTTLAIRLTMLMLPYMPMVCGVAFLGAILHVHRKFGPPAAAPVLLNMAMIVAALVAVSQQTHERAAITFVAVSVLVAGAIQIAWMAIAVWKTAPLTTAFAGTKQHFRGMLLTMLPMVVGLGVFQINTLMDGLIAYGLAAPPDDPGGSFNFAGNTYDYPMEAGAVTTLTLAQRLYQFPLGVFGIAIATAIFPSLASAAAGRGGNAKPQAADHSDQFAAIFRRGVRLTLFIGLPASVGLILVRIPLTRVFFEYGEFTSEDALRSANVLMAYASAVWAYSLTHVTTKAFYAVDDAMTPLKVSLGMVAINLVMNLTLIWPFGVAGLAWSTAFSAVVQSIVLVLLLRKHVAQPITGEVMRGIGITLGLTAAMGVAVGAVMGMVDPAALNKGQSVGVLGVCVGLGAVIVLGGGWALKLPEVREFRR
ncbi:MAG: murein biosynthesis integral membrane protein MurJ [Planctomycetota bacterium]